MEDCAGAWSLALEDAFVRRPTHASPRPGSRRGWRAGKATGPESQGSGAARPEAQPRPLPVPGSPHYRGVARPRPEAPRPGVPGRGEGARRRPGGSRPRYIFSLEEGREIGFAVTRGHLAQRTGGVRGDGPQPRSPSYPPPTPTAGRSAAPPRVRGRRLGGEAALAPASAGSLPLRTLDNEVRWRARRP